MLLSILGFFLCSIVAYTLFAVFGQLTGGSPGNFWEDVFSIFKPLPLLILFTANLFFAASLSLGFKWTHNAIPIALSVGVIVSFIYSLMFLDASFSWAKALGVVLILLGIALLR